MKDTIQIFARLKPIEKPQHKGLYEVSDSPDGASQVLSFYLAKDASRGVVNNTREQHNFRFEQIFDVHTKQDEVFEAVARPVIDQVLQGYNGTIFAYGQSGSGKTYTMTGLDGERDDVGIIPRTLAHVFKHCIENQDTKFTTQVSFLQIYNNIGYDLLNEVPGNAKNVDYLPFSRVTVVEDTDENVFVKNLSIHMAATRDEAMNQLFIGDVNRATASTSLNEASTRSHCIFTIYITSQKLGSTAYRRSKLHLVDLAGSERVSKTGTSGILLREAKCINLSLHFLEQVITALQDKGRTHTPYRNSLLTQILKDSLGGNCMTTMVATCSIEKANINESISTCCFSQRVAMVKNDAVLNEVLDPKLIIDKLKREINELKEELTLLSGEQRSDALTEEEMLRCESCVNNYLADADPEASLSVGTDLRRIQFCYKLLKKRVMNKSSGTEQNSSEQCIEDKSRLEENLLPSSYESKQLEQLVSLLKQRDYEIKVLVNLLRKEKKGAKKESESASHGQEDTESLISKHKRIASSSSSSSHLSYQSKNSTNSCGQWSTENAKHDEDRIARKLFGEMSVGREEACRMFLRGDECCREIQKIENHLKMYFSRAQMMGNDLKQCFDQIKKLQSSLLSHQTRQTLEFSEDQGHSQIPDDDVAEDFKLQIQEAKMRRNEITSELKFLKEECDHLKHALNVKKVTIKENFERWLNEQAAMQQLHQEKSERLLNRGIDKPIAPIPSDPETTSGAHHRQLDLFITSNRNSPSSIRPSGKFQKLRSESQRVETDAMPSHIRFSPAPVNWNMSTGDPETDSALQRFNNYLQVIKQGQQ